MYGPGQDAVTTPTLSVAYLSLRTNTPLLITMDPYTNGKVRDTRCKLSSCIPSLHIVVCASQYTLLNTGQYTPLYTSQYTPLYTGQYTPLYTSQSLYTSQYTFLYIQTILRTDDMDLAGDVIQSLAAYLGIEVHVGRCHPN